MLEWGIFKEQMTFASQTSAKQEVCPKILFLEALQC